MSNSSQGFCSLTVVIFSKLPGKSALKSTKVMLLAWMLSSHGHASYVVKDVPQHSPNPEHMLPRMCGLSDPSLWGGGIEMRNTSKLGVPIPSS